MKSPYESLKSELRSSPRNWLVTGGAGFIGSHLIETLLKFNQKVTCLDNYSTGYSLNLDLIRDSVDATQASLLRVVEGDLADMDACQDAVEGVDLILHQGALGSVPRSIADPVTSHRSNATGTLNLFTAAKNAGIRRVVYASSSSVYGDQPDLPKVENRVGNLLSPYAATKAIAEQYANAFSRAYDMEFAGLRYFNVFGPRQDPDGPYAAVIPIWVKTMLQGKPISIFGDGETSRDFTYVENVVQANILAATAPSLVDPSRVFNVAIGGQTSLKQLFEQIRTALEKVRPDLKISDPVYRGFRPGDVRHSLADFSRAADELGFQPTHGLAEGLSLAMDWYAGALK